MVISIPSTSKKGIRKNIACLFLLHVHVTVYEDMHIV